MLTWEGVNIDSVHLVRAGCLDVCHGLWRGSWTRVVTVFGHGFWSQFVVTVLITVLEQHSGV